MPTNESSFTMLHTSDMRVAAALVSVGGKFHSGDELPTQPGWYEFTIQVPAYSLRDCQQIMESCAHANYYDVHVHLGRYEAGLRSIRKFLRNAAQSPKERINEH